MIRLDFVMDDSFLVPSLGHGIKFLELPLFILLGPRPPKLGFRVVDEQSVLVRGVGVVAFGGRRYLARALQLNAIFLQLGDLGAVVLLVGLLAHLQHDCLYGFLLLALLQLADE
jgi:hypothetical protein